MDQKYLDFLEENCVSKYKLNEEIKNINQNINSSTQEIYRYINSSFKNNLKEELTKEITESIMLSMMSKEEKSKRQTIKDELIKECKNIGIYDQSLEEMSLLEF